MQDGKIPADLPPVAQREQANIMQNANALSAHMFSQPTEFLKMIKKDFDKIDTDHNGFISAKEDLDYSLHGNDLALRKAALLANFHGGSIAGIADQVKGHQSKGEWPFVNGISRADINQAVRLEENHTILDKAMRGLTNEIATVGSVGLMAVNGIMSWNLVRSNPGWSALYATGVLVSGGLVAGNYWKSEDQWAKVDKVRDQFKTDLGRLY